MLHELDYDDSEAPSIGLVHARRDVGRTCSGRVEIAHHPLLVALDGGADHAGAYWDGTKMIVEEDLGPDLDEAVAEFRAAAPGARPERRAPGRGPARAPEPLD